MGQCTHSEHTQCVCVCECECVCVNTHCLEWTHMFTDYVSSYSFSDIYIDSKCLVPCIHLPICLYLCISVCLSIRVSACLSVHLSVFLQTSLSVSDYYYICLSILCMSISVHLFIMTSVHPPSLSHSPTVSLSLYS